MYRVNNNSYDFVLIWAACGQICAPAPDQNKNVFFIEYIIRIGISFHRLTGRSSRLANYDIYGSLPPSFRRELLVRSNANTDYDTLVKRKAIVDSKSPAELSQISALSEIPLPRKIEEWLQTGGPR